MTLKDQPTKRKGWQLLAADILARVTFSVSSGMVIEIFIAQMTVMQSLYSRAVNTPIVMLTARPYGMFRDWMLRKLKVRKDQRMKYILANQVAYALFFCPQYALVLWLEGATWPQIWKAAGTVALTSPILGAIFGYWLDFVRQKLFGVQPPLEEEERS